MDERIKLSIKFQQVIMKQKKCYENIKIKQKLLFIFKRSL